MWTLYISHPDWAAPLRIDGYTSRDWAENSGKEAIEALHGGSYWVTKLPDQVLAEERRARAWP